MYEHYTSRFTKATLLLHAILEDQERLDLVLELQRFLIRRIAAAEGRVRRLKALGVARKKLLSAIPRPTRVQAKSIKDDIARCECAAAGQRHLLFLWRCFGDGIAFTYQDKYSLKHLYYDAQYQVKEDAGFLTVNGRLKPSFRTEFKYFKMGIRMGVPIVMADLTNVVRHGDLCALAGPDPLPVEIKSSTNQNARTIRQAENLRAITDFYVNDGAAVFRGIPNVERVALLNPEVRFQDAINACIAEGLEAGIAITSPEPGLHYIAGRQPERFAEFSHVYTRSTLAVELTPDPTWSHCYPFTLSLRRLHLLRFLREEVFILVLIDLAQVKSLFAEQGIHATMLLDGVSAIQICRDPADLMRGVYRISESLFGRIALEFQSLAWFAAEFSAPLRQIPRTITIEELATLTAIVSEIPREWYDVRDCCGDI